MSFFTMCNGRLNIKSFLSEIDDWAEINYKIEDYIGILICEGEATSIDCALYSKVYPELYVVPVGGCSTVTRLLPKMRNILSYYNMYGYAIIDRDALTKGEMKRLYNNTGVSTTKLPFIENIICSPEVIQVICEYKGLDFDKTYNKITNELMKFLWQKFKEALPINIGIDKREKIQYLEIHATTRKKDIRKRVSNENILYTFRDKVIIGIVGNAIGVKNKKAYYTEVSTLLDMEGVSDKLVKAMAKYLPKFELYEF